MLCECGCGRETRVAARTDRRAGQTKGVPLRFIKGHSGVAGRRGPDNYTFKGRIAGPGGYVSVLVQPDHPFINMAYRSGSYYIYEHRLVMALELGRELTEDEVVHHEDRDRTNNHRENLRLFSNQSAHAAYHHAMRAAA